MAETAERTMQVARVWHDSDGKPRAVTVTSAAGGGFTAGLERGQVSWAEADVWAHPGRHGLHNFYCPGHNGGVCWYGMCDETRVTDLAQLRDLAVSHVVTASDAYAYGVTDGRTAACFRYGPDSCKPSRAVPERHAAMYRNGWEHAYHAATRRS